MLRRTFLTLALAAAPFLSITASAADAPAVTEVLNKVDANLNSDSRSSSMKMTVVDKRTREFEMQSYSMGNETASIEYLAPARDKGTRMLKKGDELWMFLPAVEKTQKISGHMLRQGIMGSDMSYEDMMNSSDWEKTYHGEIETTEPLDGRPHYKIVMTAKDDTIAYPKRIAWVDTETFIPTKQELYALSGVLLKTWDMGDVRQYEGGRYYPHTMKVSDKLKEGSETLVSVTSVQFGVALQDEVFSMRWLERGGS